MRNQRYSTEDLTLLALAELSVNSTITRYTVDDGVINRMPASPLGLLHRAFYKIQEAMDEMAKGASNMAEAFAKFAEKAQVKT